MSLHRGGLVVMLLSLSACGLIVGVGDHHLAAPDADASDPQPGPGGGDAPGGDASADADADARGGSVVDVDAGPPIGTITVLATGQHSPRSVTGDSDAIYWINAASPGVPGQVMRLARVAGAIPTVLVDNLTEPFDLHMDPHSNASANWLFYTENGASPGLFQVPRDGGAVIMYDQENAAFQHLWTSSVAITEVVDRNTGFGHLRRSDIGLAPTVGTGCALYDPGAVTTYPAAFTSGSDVWFEDRHSSAILHASTDCDGSPATVFASEQTAVAMALGSEFVYWANETGEVRSLARLTPNGSINDFIVPPLTAPSGLAGGGVNHLIVPDQATGKVWRVSRSELPGLLADGQGGPRDLFTDVSGSSVMWANETSGEIVQCHY